MTYFGRKPSPTPSTTSSTHSSNKSTTSLPASNSIFSFTKAHTFLRPKETTTPSEPPQKPPLTIFEQHKQMPLARRMAVLERVNLLRASLGLPEKNLDNTLRPRKPRPVDEPVEEVGSQSDDSSSVYSQNSDAEKTDSDSTPSASASSQTTPEGDQAAASQIWKDPYAYSDEPRQSDRPEQCP